MCIQVETAELNRLVGVVIGNFLQRPLQILRIESEQKKMVSITDGKQMKQGFTSVESIVETHFLDRVHTVSPFDVFGKRDALVVIIKKINRNSVAYFLDHTLNTLNKTNKNRKLTIEYN